METALGVWQKTKIWTSRHPVRAVLVLFAVFVLLVYLPFVWHGGFEYDDWSAAGLSKACPNVIGSFRCFWPGYPDRPLASLYYSLDSNIFQAWPSGYILADLAEWLGGVLLVFAVLCKRFGLSFAASFLFIAAIPSISSTIIFSPAMQAIGSCAFLVWAASIYLLDQHLRTGRRKSLLISLTLLLVSLMLYESSMPLFGLYILWPLIIRRTRASGDYYKKYLKAYLLPVVVILLLIIAYQDFIVLHFYRYISKVRLSQIPHPVDFSLRIITNDLYVLTVGLGGFMGRALIRLRHAGLFTVLESLVLAIIVLGGWMLASQQKARVSMKASNYHWLWGGIILAFFGIALIHFVANLPPTMVGYNNRGEVAGSIIIALFGATLWQRYLSKRPIWVALAGVLFLAYLSTFMLQRDNYIKANQTRQQIQANVVPQIQAQRARDMVVLGVVPEYTPTNFNDETIFSDEVLDWGNFLRLETSVKNIQGISVSPGRISRGDIALRGGELHVLDSRDTPLPLVWYYDARTGTLTKIQNAAQLRTLLNSIAKHPPYNYPLAVDATWRNKIRDWLASY